MNRRSFLWASVWSFKEVPVSGLPTVPSTAAMNWTEYHELVEYDLWPSVASGQVFTWEVQRDLARGPIRHFPVSLRFFPGQTEIITQSTDIDKSVVEQAVRDYFQLDADTSLIYESLRAAHIDVRTPLRILKQDPWVCLMSFIISQQNTLPRIRKLVTELRIQFGAKFRLCPGWSVSHDVPSKVTIASLNEDRLRKLGLGFRAPYLLKTAQKLSEDDRLQPDECIHMDTAELRARLMDLPGVGRKIADCVLLFAYARWDVCPVDVHIGRIFTKMGCTATEPDAVQKWAVSKFGPYAGWAQQFLYEEATSTKAS